jgi:glycosyltransferase involved in cell wall biosynthesis
LTSVSRPLNRRPSVLWINQFAVLPSDGGGTRHFELGRELVHRGWDVTVVASDFHLHRRQYLRRTSVADRRAIAQRVDDVKFSWLWAAPYERNDWRRARNWLTFAASVRRYSRTMDAPDVVIGSSPQLFAARAGYRVARDFGVPFVLEVRDLWPESLVAAGSASKGPAYYALDVVAKHLYRVADRIIVLTKGNQDYLIGRGIAASKLSYVPNGVDLTGVFDRSIAATSSPESLTLVYAGAHGPANGLAGLLDAAELLGRSLKIHFVLVGDGPVKEQLRADAKRRGLVNIEFRDPVPKPDLMRMLAQADGGLMLLRNAPLFAFGVSPNKLFDYFGAGLPVVCNVPGEVASMVENAGAGVQATDSSGDALATAIRKFASLGAAARTRMGTSARAWVEREHSRSLLGARLDEQLRQLAEH